MGKAQLRAGFKVSSVSLSVILRVFKKMLMLLINLVILKHPMIRF